VGRARKAFNCMLKPKRKVFLTLLAAWLVFMPKAAFAVTLVVCGGKNQDPCTLDDLLVGGARIINWLITISGVYASMWIILGGLKYVTSMGNGEAIETAKKTIVNALTGMVLVLCAYLLVSTAVNTILAQGDKCKTIDLRRPLTYILGDEQCRNK
jgi:hypothetical protein